MVQIITIIIAVLSPAISEAADLWGRKWLLVGLTVLGVVSIVDLDLLEYDKILTQSRLDV